MDYMSSVGYWLFKTLAVSQASSEFIVCGSRVNTCVPSLTVYYSFLFLH